MDKLFNHVESNDDRIDKKLHFSHLFQYVSAYELTPEGLEDLKLSLLAGLKEAKRTCTRQIVDQDGEHFFVCNPSGSFDLCISWKSYRIIDVPEECEEIEQ